VVGIGDTRDNAIQSALRMAVEYASGAYIHSETTVENSQLINDKILSVSKALISNYSIKSEKKDDNGLTVVELKATIEDTILQNIIHENKMLTLEDAIKDYNLVENKVSQLKIASELLNLMKNKPISEKYIVKYSGYNVKSIGLKQQQIELKYSITKNPFFWNDYNKILEQIKMSKASRSEANAFKQLCMGYKCNQSVKIHQDLFEYVVGIQPIIIQFNLNDSVVGETEPIAVYDNNISKLDHTDLVLFPPNASNYPLCYEPRVIPPKRLNKLGQWGYFTNGECDPNKSTSDVFKIPENGYEDTTTITITNSDLIKELPKLTLSMKPYGRPERNNRNPRASVTNNANNKRPTPVQAVNKPAPTKSEAVTSDLGIWDGFRGVKWGTDIKTIPEMVEFGSTKSGVVFYTKPNEVLTLGEVKLQKIIYGFYKGRFVWATVVADPAYTWRSVETNKTEYKQIEDIYNILSARFGKDIGKINRSAPCFINSACHISKWEQNGMSVTYVPSQQDDYSGRYNNQSFIDFKYAPIIQEMENDRKTAEQTALANHKAEIDSASITIQPTNALKEGFRGVKWGSDISQYSDMVPFSNKNAGQIYYTRTGEEDFSLAGVKFEKIFYVFYKGKFVQGQMITHAVNDDTRDKTLREVVEARYGSKNRQDTPLEWNLGDVLVNYYSYSDMYRGGNKYQGHAYFEVINLPIAREIVKDEQIALKNKALADKEKLKKTTSDSF